MATPEPQTTRDRPRRQYSFGDFTLDLEGGFLRRGAGEVTLRPKAFEVLAYLVEHHGRLVSKDGLIEAVWRDAAITDNSLAQCLLEIRRALADDSQILIRTVPRRGYVFTAPVTSPVLEFPSKGGGAPTDALAATIDEGDTRVPEMVAEPDTPEGLPVRVAAACFSTAIASLIVFAILAPRTGFLSRIRVETSDALERVARDTLANLGVHDPVRHHVSRFGYDIEAVRRHFDSAAMYFWYRASPSWMIPYDLTGVMTAGNPPVELPGMLTTKWDGTGRLLYLKAVPSDRGTSAMTAPELWTRLFTAAGLQLGRFEPAEPGWIPGPAWDARASWTGTYPDAKRTPIRIEAAAWHGRPVYFDVVPGWRHGEGDPLVATAQRTGASEVTAFVVLFAASALLTWRNVRLGRSDRRGGFRVAAFIFLATFFVWMCKASHVADITEFTLLAMGLSWTGFLAVGFWTLYMAFEPYVRRRWPHALVSWTRILSGKIRDPVVGGHILIGTTFGAVTGAVVAIGVSVADVYGLYLPSYWMLSGTRGTLAYALGTAVNAVPKALFVLFVTFLCKVFFRREWPAVIGTAALAFVFEPAITLRPAAAGIFFVPIAAGFVYLVLRSGLLSLVIAIYVTTILLALPVSSDLSVPATQASILMLCGLGALALFGFHSTLAGRRLFKLDL